MKRTTAILFLLLYTVSVSGTTFSIHFCGKRLQSVSLGGLAHAKCCCGSKKMKSNCCEDTHVSFQLHTKHNSHTATSIPVSIPKLTPVLLPEFMCHYNLGFARTISNFHSPPIRCGDPDLLIAHSIFRI